MAKYKGNSWIDKYNRQLIMGGNLLDTIIDPLELKRKRQQLRLFRRALRRKSFLYPFIKREDQYVDEEGLKRINSIRR